MTRGVKVFVIIAIIGITGCPSNARALKWYEETWHHEDGELQFIISGYSWTLIYRGENDEKGTITFNEPAQTFSMKSTHQWDKDINDWREHSERKTGNYSLSGNTLTVNNHTWVSFNGKWTKTATNTRK